ALLRADQRHDFALRIERDVEPRLVPIRSRLPECRQTLVIGVAMVRGTSCRVAELGDDVIGCRQIGITDAEADDVDAASLEGVFLLVDLSEQIGRKSLNSLGFLDD